MEPGEKEMRMAFEEVTTKNVKTCVEYTTQTRNLVRELEAKVLALQDHVVQQNALNIDQQQKIVVLQAKLYEATR